MRAETPRNGHAPPAESPPQASVPFHIDRDAVYRPEHLAAGLAIPLSGIKRDIRSGKLKASKRRGRLFVLGEQVLEWLRVGVVHRKGAGAAADGING
jgi:hypothetical protein